MANENTSFMIAGKHQTMRRIVQNTLRGTGYSNFLIANTGLQAWKMLNEFSPAIIVLDDSLEDYTCLELLKKIRWSEEYCNRHVLVLAMPPVNQSLYSSDGSERTFVLQKPFNTKSLIESFTVILGDYFKNLDTKEASFQPLTQESFKEKVHQKECTLEIVDGMSSAFVDKNVLIAEDSAMILHLLRNHLKSMGFSNILAAKNGEKAWSIIEASEKIDLIVSDWKMPGLTGIELLDRIRSNDRYKDVPFVMITSEAKTENILIAGKHNASAYITKPFTYELFSCTVARALE